MSSPAAAPSRTTRTRNGTRIAQLDTHERLLRDVSAVSPPPRHGRTDAIIVPASRPASALAGVIALAAELGTFLVVLCSLQAKADQVAERIRRRPGARGVAVQLDEYCLPVSGLRTLTDEFDAVNGGRTSDLSLKRNFGLLFARRCGWDKVVFVDDDITVPAAGVARLVHQLDNHQIAGMACRDFPDNSVVCHARRLAGFSQDVFVTGAVLGVNCGDQPLPFFPHVYNEDWFFFGEAAASHQLPKAGEAHQAPYSPFAETLRAQHEEFGDLLAEGLYFLIENQGPGYSFRQTTHRANEAYWERFIQARMRNMAETTDELNRILELPHYHDDVADAVKSLEMAAGRYEGKDAITPERCVAFLRAWEHDARVWRQACQRTHAVRTVADALSALEVDASKWQAA